MTLRSEYRQKPPALRDAEDRGIPIYVLKANTIAQMQLSLTSVFALEVDPREAALRETHEETGLRTTDVEVLGALDELLTGTGFLIKPVVGYVAAGSFVATPDPTEVASVFEVPLEFIVEPENVMATYRERLGARFRTYELHHSGHRIWGATAAILVSFMDVISHE